MTQTTDTHPTDALASLAYQAKAIQRFCNPQGRFWHKIFVLGEHPTNPPSKALKGWAYDGAYHIARHFGLDRAENMLDLLAALDTYNAAAAAHGFRQYRIVPANRAAIVDRVTPRS